MNVNLRKADVIQKQLLVEMQSIIVNPQVTITIFDKPLVKLSHQREKMVTELTNHTNLNRVLYKIRRSVQHASAKVNIPDLLARKAEIAKELEVLEILVNLVPYPSDEEVEMRFKRLDQPVTSQFEKKETSFTICALLAEDQERFRAKKASLKKEAREIGDNLLKLNMITEILLDDETISVLTKFNLL